VVDGVCLPCRNRQVSAEVRAAIRLAAERRVEAVWTCLGVLCPDLTAQAKKALAEKVFEVCRGEDRKAPRIMITPAQVTSIIWGNMQCIIIIRAAPWCCSRIRLRTDSMSRPDPSQVSQHAVSRDPGRLASTNSVGRFRPLGTASSVVAKRLPQQRDPPPPF